jgi:tRNA(fMet)-specific endonuclease VapC
MSLKYLLDTNIVSYYLRRTSPALEQRVNDALAAKSVAISVLTRAELRYGQAGMSQEDKRRGLIDRFLPRLPNLQWTVAAADIYGSIKAEHRRVGRLIGEIDTQIAAHALTEDLILVTHNTRHFERVPDLKLEDWT